MNSTGFGRSSSVPRRLKKRGAIFGVLATLIGAIARFLRAKDADEVTARTQLPELNSHLAEFGAFAECDIGKDGTVCLINEHKVAQIGWTDFLNVPEIVFRCHANNSGDRVWKREFWTSSGYRPKDHRRRRRPWRMQLTPRANGGSSDNIESIFTPKSTPESLVAVDLKVRDTTAVRGIHVELFWEEMSVGAFLERWRHRMRSKATCNFLQRQVHALFTSGTLVADHVRTTIQSIVKMI